MLIVQFGASGSRSSYPAPLKYLSSNAAPVQPLILSGSFEIHVVHSGARGSRSSHPSLQYFPKLIRNTTQVFLFKKSDATKVNGALERHK
jgi:hypothetical protein